MAILEDTQWSRGGTAPSENSAGDNQVASLVNVDLRTNPGVAQCSRTLISSPSVTGRFGPVNAVDGRFYLLERTATPRLMRLNPDTSKEEENAFTQAINARGFAAPNFYAEGAPLLGSTTSNPPITATVGDQHLYMVSPYYKQADTTTESHSIMRLDTSDLTDKSVVYNGERGGDGYPTFPLTGRTVARVERVYGPITTDNSRPFKIYQMRGIGNDLFVAGHDGTDTAPGDHFLYVFLGVANLSLVGRIVPATPTRLFRANSRIRILGPHTSPTANVLIRAGQKCILLSDFTGESVGQQFGISPEPYLDSLVWNNQTTLITETGRISSFSEDRGLEYLASVPDVYLSTDPFGEVRDAGDKQSAQERPAMLDLEGKKREHGIFSAFVDDTDALYMLTPLGIVSFERKNEQLPYIFALKHTLPPLSTLTENGEGNAANRRTVLISSVFDPESRIAFISVGLDSYDAQSGKAGSTVSGSVIYFTPATLHYNRYSENASILTKRYSAFRYAQRQWGRLTIPYRKYPVGTTISVEVSRDGKDFIPFPVRNNLTANFLRSRNNVASPGAAEVQLLIEMAGSEPGTTPSQTPAVEGVRIEDIIIDPADTV